MYQFNQIVENNLNDPVEIILKSSRKELIEIVQTLHVMGFVEIGEWCRIVPNKLEGNFITLISRNKHR